MTLTLADVLPSEFKSSGSSTLRYASVAVVERHDSTIRRWPGKQKNVFEWYVLANGRAVGWNENPASGWSFPVIRYTHE